MAGLENFDTYYFVHVVHGSHIFHNHHTDLTKRQRNPKRDCCSAVSNMELPFKNSDDHNMMSSHWVMLMLYCIIVTSITSRIIAGIS